MYLLFFDILFFIIAGNAIVSSSSSNQFTYLAVLAKTSRFYGNDANTFNCRQCHSIQSIFSYQISFVITVLSLHLSYRHAVAKSMCAFMLCKNLMPRTNANATSMTANPIHSTKFGFNQMYSLQTIILCSFFLFGNVILMVVW